jgi:glycosyltransferase involved in cell wall biosynthesis
MRVAFTLTGGATFWTGGFNFLRNAFRVLRTWRRERLVPVLYVGPGVTEAEEALLAAELDEPVERAPWLTGDARRVRFLRALATGSDRVAADAFRRRGVEAVFEAGEYWGARFPYPILTWIADFQSQYLPEMFSRAARWRTYVGRHLQLLGARTIMLSSEDAKRDCARFYPASVGRALVVPFAVLPQSRPLPDPDLPARYGLPARFLFLPNQFWKHKNHKIVIEALPSVLKARPDLIVATSGSPVDHRHPRHLETVVALVGERGVSHAFRWLGMIPSDDVRALMELSVALVNPSLFEGWSTTVEEAKSVGVPMVLSALRVHKEQAGSQALYFDPHSPESTARALITAWDARTDDPATRRERAAPGVAARTAEYADRLVGAFEAARDRASVRQRGHA